MESSLPSSVVITASLLLVVLVVSVVVLVVSVVVICSIFGRRSEGSAFLDIMEDEVVKELHRLLRHHQSLHGVATGRIVQVGRHHDRCGRKRIISILETM